MEGERIVLVLPDLIKKRKSSHQHYFMWNKEGMGFEWSEYKTERKGKRRRKIFVGVATANDVRNYLSLDDFIARLIICALESLKKVEEGEWEEVTCQIISSGRQLQGCKM